MNTPSGDFSLSTPADVFPPSITALPMADLPLSGATAFLSQGDGHQILFMHFAADVELPEHAHAAQWGVVLEGSIDLVIAGTPHTFVRGDRYHIPAGVPHRGFIHAGYADITWFAQADRYRARPRPAAEVP